MQTQPVQNIGAGRGTQPINTPRAPFTTAPFLQFLLSCPPQNDLANILSGRLFGKLSLLSALDEGQGQSEDEVYLGRPVGSSRGSQAVIAPPFSNLGYCPDTHVLPAVPMSSATALDAATLKGSRHLLCQATDAAQRSDPNPGAWVFGCACVDLGEGGYLAQKSHGSKHSQ